MKSLKAFFLVAVLSFTAILAHANIEPTKAAAKIELQKQVNEIIVDGLENLNLEQDTKLMVKFMVTSDSRIVVLSTTDKGLDRTIKNTLNYKKVDVGDEILNEVFFIPVRLTIK